MKRNLLPLLAIAFVVAAISTGLFYGLMAGKLRASSTSELPRQSIVIAAKNLARGKVLKPEDLRISEIRGGEPLKGSFDSTDKLVGGTLFEQVMEGEPITASHVVVKGAQNSAAAEVPAGMRAVSVKIYESSGLLPLLHRGSRVDLQAVRERNGAVDLRTILQNVEVLALDSPAEGPGRNAPPVLTVLTAPAESDLLAVADSGARLRAVLRNTSDTESRPRHIVAVAALFDRPQTLVAPAAAQNHGVDTDAPLELAFSVLRATPEISARLSETAASDFIQVRELPATTVDGLHSDKAVEVVQSVRMTATTTRPAIFRAASGACRLKLKVASAAQPGGGWNLRVAPEVVRKHESGSESRGTVREVALGDGAGVVVSGLLDARRDRASLEKLFPGRSWDSRELLILITPVVHGAGGRTQAATPRQLVSRRQDGSR